MSEDHPWLAKYLRPEIDFFAEEKRSALEAVQHATTEKKKAEAKRELDKAEEALRRVDSYRTEMNSKLQCPHCWVANRVQSDLHRIPRESLSVFYKCIICGKEYENDGKKNY